MLKNIRISELQFHLRDENCKVYPATINELPFYLCLKHDDRKIYDEYFNQNQIEIEKYNIKLLYLYYINISA